LPILNTRVQADTQGAEKSSSEVIPVNMLLAQFGPIVKVTLSLISRENNAIHEVDENTHEPVNGSALIDTGASVTCFDPEAATKAGLIIADSGPRHSATHTNEIVPIYAGSLLIHKLGFGVNVHRAYGASLKEQNLVALIGRDILSNCMLVYNGPDASFSLSI